MKGKTRSPVYCSQSSILITVSVILFLWVLFTLRESFPDVFVTNKLRRLSVKVLPDVDDAALSQLPPESFNYITIIDAGSSGCRAHVYRYGALGNTAGPIYVLPQHVSMKVKPGLSSFASHPADAGASLADLIVFMKQNIPQADWGHTPIYLKATAGLRLLDASISVQILRSVRDFLSDASQTPFLFQPSHARIINGKDEGAYGWLAVNYLMKHIGPRKKAEISEPYAVIEMGGASTQVTQLATTTEHKNSIHSDYLHLLSIDGTSYILYAHSYLGYGGEQARETLNKHLMSSATANTVHDPCLNKGYTRSSSDAYTEVYEGPANANVHGAADATSCIASTNAALFKANTNCKTTHSSYSFNCVHQPEFVRQSQNILLFENFYYAASGAGTQPHNHETTPGATVKNGILLTSPKEYSDSANEVCELEYSNLYANYPKDSQPKEVNRKICFSTSYAHSFLTSGLQLHPDRVVTVQKEIGGSEIEWALGAAYKEAANFVEANHLRTRWNNA